jgi:hypothetical protein
MMRTTNMQDWLAVICALLALLGIAVPSIQAACGKCRRPVNCMFPLIEGSSDCGFCDPGAGITTREVCCDHGNILLGCVYTGGAACSNHVHMTGTRNGSPGSCGSCTAVSYANNGVCTGIVNAQGDVCP